MGEVSIPDSNGENVNIYVANLSNLYNEIDCIYLSPGTFLYTATEKIEESLVSKICPETGKFGIYFSANDEFLAELECLKRQKDLFICVYQTKFYLKLSLGRIPHIQSQVQIQPQSHLIRNVSHINTNPDEIIPKIDFDDSTLQNSYAEVFLNDNDLQYLEPVEAYLMTVNEARKKWGK